MARFEPGAGTKEMRVLQMAFSIKLKSFTFLVKRFEVCV
jgi:hypothetical protein